MSNVGRGFGWRVRKKIEGMLIEEVEIGMVMKNMGGYLGFEGEWGMIKRWIELDGRWVYDRREEGMVREMMM